LLAVQQLSHDPAGGQAAILQITSPLTTQTGSRVAGLRLAGPPRPALRPSVSSGSF
jgi:hypothetical protein